MILIVLIFGVIAIAVAFFNLGVSAERHYGNTTVGQ